MLSASFRAEVIEAVIAGKPAPATDRAVRIQIYDAWLWAFRRRRGRGPPRRVALAEDGENAAAVV